MGRFATLASSRKTDVAVSGDMRTIRTSARGMQKSREEMVQRPSQERLTTNERGRAIAGVVTVKNGVMLNG